MTPSQRISNAIKSWAGCETLVFCLALFVYALTLRPGLALWDSGEFICAATGLDVGHPPGAPLYWLVLRLATILAPFAYTAAACNAVSALSCAAAAALLYRCVRLMLHWGAASLSSEARAVAGVCAGLTWAFCGSTWAVAVETEVYGAASLLAFAILWAALRWQASREWRFVMLLALLVGVTAGVHWLGWLTLPIAGAVIGSAWGRKGMFIGAMIGSLAVPLLAWLASGHIFDLALLADIACVNLLGLPPMVGWAATVFLTIALLFLTALWQKGVVGRIAAIAALTIIGFTTYAIPMLRAASGVAVSISAPSDPARLADYMARSQYASRPLFFGPTYSSRPNGVETEVKMYLDPTTNRYAPREVASRYSYPADQCVALPRMTETDEAALWAYRQWAAPDAWPDSIPSLAANLRFMTKYQMGHMMARYVMWNFCGRQNGQIGDGGYASGNFITGIAPMDRLALGLPQYDEPSEGRISLFAIPIFAALIGLSLLFQRKMRKMLFAVGLWIAICGPALAFYVNMPPFEPRERDYIFLTLYAGFCVAIGLCLAKTHSFLTERKIPSRLASIIAIAIPALMSIQTWPSASRRADTLPDDLATSVLNLCPPDAIVVTGGDNDTYPLWYAQQALAHRRDVRIVNYHLLAAPWHVASLLRAGRDNAPLVIPHGTMAARGDLSTAFLLPSGEDTLTLADFRDIQTTPFVCNPYIPTARLRIPLADTSVVVSPAAESLSPSALLLLEIIASNPDRTVCLMPGAVTDDIGLTPYTRNIGPLTYVTPYPHKPLDLNALIDAIHLPDAETYSPTDDETSQTSRLDLRGLCLAAARQSMASADDKTALRTLRKSFSWLPPRHSPTDTTLLATAAMLHDLGDVQLCRHALADVADVLSLRLRWADALAKTAPIVSRSMREAALAPTRRLIKTLRKTGNNDIATALADVANNNKQQ